MNVITIEKAGEHEGQEVTVRGWLYNLRESGKLLFPIFRDGTGLMQGVVSQTGADSVMFDCVSPLVSAWTRYAMFDGSAFWLEAV